MEVKIVVAGLNLHFGFPKNRKQKTKNKKQTICCLPCAFGLIRFPAPGDAQ
jgi:hypothetical protein